MGFRPLRKVLGEYLGCDPELLAITSGVRSSVSRLASGSSRALIERPTFLEVPAIMAAQGLEVVSQPWGELLADSPDPPALLWVTSPARNPDGRTLTAEESGRLDKLAASGSLVIVNTTYRWSAPRAPLPAGAVVVGGLSKLAGGGAGLGWIHYPPHRVPREPCHTGGPAKAWQATWTSFIAAGGLDELRTHIYDPACTAANDFKRRLGTTGDGPSASTASPHLLLRAPGSRDGEWLAQELLAHGIKAGPGSAFAAQEASVRLSFFGTRPEGIEQLATTVRQIFDSEEAVIQWHWSI